MKLPAKIADQRLFQRGALIKMIVEDLVTGPKPKFFVLVSIDEDADPVLIALCTSKTAWFDAHKNASGIAAGDGYRLPITTKRGEPSIAVRFRPLFSRTLTARSQQPSR